MPSRPYPFHLANIPILDLTSLGTKLAESDETRQDAFATSRKLTDCLDAMPRTIWKRTVPMTPPPSRWTHIVHFDCIYISWLMGDFRFVTCDAIDLYIFYF
jgi:hypothetical protein